MKTDAGIRAVTIVFALGVIKMQILSIFSGQKNILKNIDLGRRYQKTSKNKF